MRNLNTKAGRLELQNYQFESLVNDGYTKEVYSELVIFTKVGINNKFYYKIFRGTAAKPVQNFYTNSAERMASEIANYKKNFDRHQTYKEEQKANKTASTAANCAAAIRAELKVNFPGVRFTVKSENYSGGNSVRVAWTDGPTTKMIDDVINKYQYGHFNGMDDIYEYTNSREDIAQAKYVSSSRTISEEYYTALLPIVKQRFNCDDYGHNSAQTYVNRLLYNTVLLAGAVISGVAYNEKGGILEDCYYITFEGESLSKVGAEVAEKEAAEILEVSEVEPGTVQMVDYSEKAFAIIGETKAIKEDLKRLGGKFNKYLSCGPGWIFSKKSIDAVTAFLSADNLPEAVTPSEAASGPETPAGEVIQPENETTLNDEIKITVQSLAEMDLKSTGEIGPGVYEAAKVQQIDLFSNVPAEFQNLNHLAEQEKTVKIIPLFSYDKSKIFNC